MCVYTGMRRINTFLKAHAAHTFVIFSIRHLLHPLEGFDGIVWAGASVFFTTVCGTTE